MNWPEKNLVKSNLIILYLGFQVIISSCILLCGGVPTLNLIWLQYIVAIVSVSGIIYLCTYGSQLNNTRYVTIGALLLELFIVDFSELYLTLGLTSDGRVVHSGAASLYFSIITLTTVGYGDLVPVPGQGRFVAAAEALIGYAFLAVVISRLVASANSQSFSRLKARRMLFEVGEQLWASVVH